MAALRIVPDGYGSPDGTYFSTKDAQPELQEEEGEQVLKLVNGDGTRRGWGTPGVTSTVILQTDELVVVHVGYHHKHGGGQFYRYYYFLVDEWEQVEWRDLVDELRNVVIEAYTRSAPDWAKAPGKLRSEYITPQMEKITHYKIVEVVEGRYRSVYDGETEYVMGKRLAERALNEHGGGYYSYPNPEMVMMFFHTKHLFPSHCYEKIMELAVIECEVSGHMVKYDNGKVATTYLKPLRELSRFTYEPEQMQEAS